MFLEAGAVSIPRNYGIRSGVPTCRESCTFPKIFAMRDERFLTRKLKEREAQDALRRLRLPERKVDLCSNDYLGMVTNGLLEHGMVAAGPPADAHGSGGSRLLAGNYPLIEETEWGIATFHAAPAALIYNSGYDANLGLLSSVPQRGDVILYDSLSHASIRDGMRLSLAQAYGFAHNDLGELEKRLRAAGEGGAGDLGAGGRRCLSSQSRCSRWTGTWRRWGRWRSSAGNTMHN